MATTLEQFVENLVQSGLMSAAEVAAFRQTFETLPPDERPSDAQAMARCLLQAGKITKYQAQAVYQGKTKGLILGEYVVLDKLGQGGMGVVFKAKHRRLGRLVAVKVLPAAAMKSPDTVRRFYREVAAAGRLDHPNIVMAYDAGEADGVHYLAMEYVEGKDLAKILSELGRLPASRAVEYVLQTARGLLYAHAQGIVHRDIKPANLLVDGKSTVKILDMGLARMTGAAAAFSGPSEQLTRSGEVMGTCDYMAPEQAEDTHTVDHRADIYSLGCTLYRLITGQAPYGGDSLIKLLLAHREAPIPSLCEKQPDAPGALDGIFHKMVAKRPEDRYPSMQEVIADLEGFLSGFGPAPPLPNRPTIPDEKGELARNLSFLEELAPTPSALATRRQAATQESKTLRGRGREDTGRSLAARVRHAVASARRKPAVTFAAVAVGAAVVMVVATLALRPGPSPGGGQAKGAAGAHAEKAESAGDFATPPRDTWTDLLRRVDVDRDRVEGSWTRSGGALTMATGGCSRLMMPVVVEGSYDFEVSFTKTDGVNSVVIALPVGPQVCALALNVDALRYHWSALTTIDGRDQEGNPTYKRHDALINGQKYVVLINVRLDAEVADIRVSLDGQPFLQWTGKPASLDLTPSWQLPDRKRIGLGGYESAVTFHSARLRLRGTAEGSRPHSM